MDYRPKIIVMMLTSFDGKAKGKYLFNQGSPKSALIEFFKEFEKVPHEGDIYGSNTIKEAYAPGEVDLSKYKNLEKIPLEDFISPKKLNYFVFTFDRKGNINWKNCNFDSVEWMNCPEEVGKIPSHAVEILLENVSNEYLHFLREKEISYFFAGKEEFDFELALKKMKNLFNVNTVILGGGPTINGIFFEKNLCDEVNLFIIPCSGDNECDQGIFGKGGKFVEFDLIDIKKFDKGIVLLKYKRKE